MTLTIKINLDNAAFEEDRTTEAARILADLVVNRLCCQEIGDKGSLLDANGNSVGGWRVT